MATRPPLSDDIVVILVLIGAGLTALFIMWLGWFVQHEAQIAWADLTGMQ